MGKIFITLLMLALSLTLACTKKQEPSPAKPARISATKVYEQYFGPAPTSDKGTCYAFVIYFPSAKERGKVVPFPFFTFDEGSIKKVAAERLLGGMEAGSYSGEFLQPFPAGTHLLGVTQEKGTVTVSFSKEILNPKLDEAAGKTTLNALVLTLSQFTGVTDVRVQVEGKEAEKFLGHDMRKSQPQVADETTVAQPSPPRLLSVTAVRDEGAKDVEEVSAYFDRPIDIKEIKITDTNGKPFEGDVYHSVFEMAAVLKPKAPSLFKAGMPVKVRWQVMDKLGRSGGAAQEFNLEVKEH